MVGKSFPESPSVKGQHSLIVTKLKYCWSTVNKLYKMLKN